MILNTIFRRVYRIFRNQKRYGDSFILSTKHTRGILCGEYWHTFLRESSALLNSYARYLSLASSKEFYTITSIQKNAKYILPIIFLILFIIMFYATYNESLYEKFESNQKIHAMTFGGGGQNFYDAVNRLTTELKNTNVFDDIISFVDTDLKNDADFWKMHGEFIENNKRGYGYWIWKPYLIMKTLETMQEHDILFYTDSGCEITDYSQESIELLKKMAENCNKYNILYTQTSHDEKSHTKMDVFSHLNIMNEDIMNSIEHQAAIIIIKKQNSLQNL